MDKNALNIIARGALEEALMKAEAHIEKLEAALEECAKPFIIGNQGEIDFEAIARQIVIDERVPPSMLPEFRWALQSRLRKVWIDAHNAALEAAADAIMCIEHPWPKGAGIAAIRALKVEKPET